MMLGALKTAVTFLPMIGVGISGVAVAGAGFWAWNTFIDNPRIEGEQRAICVATVELAAERARNEERERQDEIARMLTRAFNQRLTQMQLDQQAVTAAMEEEIENYESHLSDEDRACTGLTDSMRSFVLGN